MIHDYMSDFSFQVEFKAIPVTIQFCKEFHMLNPQTEKAVCPNKDVWSYPVPNFSSG